MTKNFWLLVFAPCALALSLGACSSDEDDSDDGPGFATAEVKDQSGNKLGTASFSKEGDEIKLIIGLSNVATKSQEVGIHIHEKAICDAANGFRGAGDHWNPGKTDYNGTPDMGWLGELGKLTIDAEGKASKTWSYSTWRLGSGDERDVVGRAIILHDVDATPDDGMPAPRQGCGEVKADP